MSQRRREKTRALERRLDRRDHKIAAIETSDEYRAYAYLTAVSSAIRE